MELLGSSLGASGSDFGALGDERVSIETGLRQGGRFSTTGAKLTLQHLNEGLRTLSTGVHIGYPDVRCHDLEFADDEMLSADDSETFTTACRLFTDSVKVKDIT